MLGSYLNQAAADSRVVRFPPHGYVVLVDGRGGLVEGDLDPYLAVTIGVLVLPVKPRGSLCAVATLLMMMSSMLQIIAVFRCI